MQIMGVIFGLSETNEMHPACLKDISPLWWISHECHLTSVALMWHQSVGNPKRLTCLGFHYSQQRKPLGWMGTQTPASESSCAGSCHQSSLISIKSMLFSVLQYYCPPNKTTFFHNRTTQDYWKVLSNPSFPLHTLVLSNSSPGFLMVPFFNAFLCVLAAFSFSVQTIYLIITT